MRNLVILIGVLLLAVISGCAPQSAQYNQVALPDLASNPLPEPLGPIKSVWKRYDASLYVPDTNHLDHMPYREVQIALHFMNTSDTLYRYNGEEGLQYAKDLVYYANNLLKNNRAAWLTPPGVEVPVVPTRYYLKLANKPDGKEKAIYFHYDDEFYWYLFKGRNRNLGDRRVVEKYAQEKDRVLNIFFQAPPRDSLDSPTFQPAEFTGVFIGNAIKIASLHPKDRPAWEHASIINHEIGHAFGLHHAWLTDDGCADTRKHPNNCWSPEAGPHCDTMTSNNIMDYSYVRNSWTPCQIGRVHARMSDLDSKQRGWLSPKWCTPWKGREIVIEDQIVWEGDRDLRKTIRIQSGARLVINSRLHLARDAKIIVEAGGQLTLGPRAWLHNACGEEWGGVEIGRRGQRRGIIETDPNARIENAAR